MAAAHRARAKARSGARELTSSSSAAAALLDTPPRGGHHEMVELFRQSREATAAREAPLAARMRPQTLEEVVGQSHLLGSGHVLRRAIENDALTSVILYGPPGTGKTSIAHVIAGATRAHFETLNAVTAGVADLRRLVQEARDRRALYGTRTILFIDEIHRFNKAQQDALLPFVEDGTVTLIGATTENPFFEVNSTLISRSRVFVLEPLSAEDLVAILDRAVSDPRGVAADRVVLAPEAARHIAGVANGDARRDRVQGLKVGARRPSDHVGDGRFPRAGRPVQDHRC